jgi:hypothetical protein
MQKNNDRYKEDYSHLDIEELDELETKKFEKFQPKKKKNKGKIKDNMPNKDDE